MIYLSTIALSMKQMFRIIFDLRSPSASLEENTIVNFLQPEASMSEADSTCLKAYVAMFTSAWRRVSR